MNLARQFTESLSLKTQCDRSVGWAADCQTVEPATCRESGAPPAEPASVAAQYEGEAPIFGIAQIIELILKDRRRLDRIAHATDKKIDLASRLLAISVTLFALYGLTMGLTFYAAHQWPQVASPAHWLTSPQMPLVTFVEAVGPRSHVAVQ